MIPDQLSFPADRDAGLEWLSSQEGAIPIPRQGATSGLGGPRARRWPTAAQSTAPPASRGLQKQAPGCFMTSAVHGEQETGNMMGMSVKDDDVATAL